jgi:hypothetical protein
MTSSKKREENWSPVSIRLMVALLIGISILVLLGATLDNNPVHADQYTTPGIHGKEIPAQGVSYYRSADLYWEAIPLRDGRLLVRVTVGAGSSAKKYPYYLSPGESLEIVYPGLESWSPAEGGWYTREVTKVATILANPDKWELFDNTPAGKEGGGPLISLWQTHQLVISPEGQVEFKFLPFQGPPK